MSLNTEIVAALDKITESIEELKLKIKNNNFALAAKTEQAVTSQSVPDLDSLEALKAALLSDKWPEAVNPHLICNPNSESDKVERGRGIIELMIEDDLKGLKVLDYGCGEGHCISLSADYQTEISVGYDIKSFDSWRGFMSSGKPNLALTTNAEEVQMKGPYDVIIMFDVLDHLQGEEPIAVLKKAQQLLSPTGKIYMRTHPFISRHGTHLYHDINKAYIHLVFTPEELEQILPNPSLKENSIGVTKPMATYEGFIGAAGLKTVSKRDVTEKVEPFFKIPKIAERIMKTTGMGSFPEFQMRVQFMDYVLTRK